MNKRCNNINCNNPIKDINGLLPISEFSKHPTTKDRLDPRCKNCIKIYRSTLYSPDQRHQRYLLRKSVLNTPKGKLLQRKHTLKYIYGISEEDYNQLLLKQNNTCAICKQEETVCDNRTGKPKRLAVDHNHLTGEIRGLLCDKCNRGIGYLKCDEGTDLLIEAQKYIQGAYVS